MLAHAFGDLGLAALTVRVLESNSRAIACYTRCGFVYDRREPDAVTLGGIPGTRTFSCGWTWSGTTASHAELGERRWSRSSFPERALRPLIPF